MTKQGHLTLGETGEVKREDVLYVLKAHGVGITPQNNTFPDMLVLVKGEYLEARRVPTLVSRRTLHYLSRRFDIPIHHFYHPEMASLPPGTVVN